jgi:hypothetical protein
MALLSLAEFSSPKDDLQVKFIPGIFWKDFF